ncbi:VOC family protein [Actinoplanes sp. NPDC049802]|uniref:VOC family protein n=1 Tax=Actinoplanes sp. NPDC049802 TaxID=3154742 RepID=UPI0033DB5F60
MTGFLDTPGRDGIDFWLAVTASTLSRWRQDGTFATLQPPQGDAFLRVQVVGDPPARAHPDLHVDDLPAASHRAVALGAELVETAEGLTVLRSPAGILFCLVAWTGESVRPGALEWPGGQRSLVDQLCLDIPDSRHAREVEFWGSLTGWQRRPSDLPEFSYLVRPDGLPLRLLLQRTGGETAGVHVDLACDDVDAEVARHVALGARVVRRVPGDWTTLLDPAGREYCVTGRSPTTT